MNSDKSFYLKEIKNKKYNIAVIVLGYVGLALVKKLH